MARLDQILGEITDGDMVGITMASNEDDQIVSYAEGSLKYHKATGGIILDGPPFRPARFEGDVEMFFSDRKKGQPFDVDATERAQIRLTANEGSDHQAMTLRLFGGASTLILNPMGDLLVGFGPMMSAHPSPSVFVVSFSGIRPPA
jgi:hypothetical protein